MSAIPLLLLATAVTAAAAGGAALLAARGLRRRLDGLGAQLEAERTARSRDAEGDSTTVPRARTAVAAEEIRGIVAEAIAEERERELAEARAFWAAQEQRGDATDERTMLAGHGTEYEIAPAPAGIDAALFDALLKGRVDDDVLECLRELRERDVPEPGIFVPRQADRDIEPALDLYVEPSHEDSAAEHADAPGAAPAATEEHEEQTEEGGAEPPGVTAARRRHPSHPDYTLSGGPAPPGRTPPSRAQAVAEHERTVGRLAELADARTPLADVRQGPLGTLDVYLFEDGTTVCLSPGHRETAGELSAALREGDVPVLMGGSSVSGAYALTFAYGQGRTVYLLADRVIASL